MKQQKFILSNMDKLTFTQFEKRYKGWKIVRYEDNSMEFFPPEREGIFRGFKRVIHESL